MKIMSNIAIMDDNEYVIIVGEVGNLLVRVSNGEHIIAIFKSRIKELAEMPEEDLLRIAKATKDRLFAIMKFYRDKDQEAPQWTYVIEKNCINKAIQSKDHCDLLSYKNLLADRVSKAAEAILKFELAHEK